MSAQPLRSLGIPEGTVDLDELSEQGLQSPLLQEIFKSDTFETIAESATAYVTRALFREPSQDCVVVVIKSASVDRRFSKQPHDIGKELRILLTLPHTNVIQVLGHTYETSSATLHYWMPFVPVHLSDVLSSPHFSPHSPPGGGPADPTSFLVLAKSLTYQMLSALDFIHERGIAHRDVKPGNLLLTRGGLVQLIDFGVAWTPEPDERDLWPEPRGNMCVDVATGSYRAPELLFGPMDYDACATDLWSLGAVLGEFFTPMRLHRAFEEEDDWYAAEEESDSDSDSAPAVSPFVVPKGLSPDHKDVEWARDTLFDGSRGQIGLAWSIFRAFGTPTAETWPTFKDLPDAQKVTFVQVPPTKLERLFPSLPPVESNEQSKFLDIVVKLLQYPPDSRVRAGIALEHPLLHYGLPVLLPSDYSVANDRITKEWEGHGLTDVLLRYLSGAR